MLLSHRVHLYPFRTQKLSCAEPKILVWRRTGKIGQCQHFFRLKFVKIAGREQKTVYSPLNIPLSPLLFLTLYIHSIGSDIPNRKRYLWSNLPILHFAFCILHLIYSSIAQSVERMTVNHDVTGSSPVRGAIKEKHEHKFVLFFYFFSYWLKSMTIWLSVMPVPTDR